MRGGAGMGPPLLLPWVHLVRSVAFRHSAQAGAVPAELDVTGVGRCGRRLSAQGRAVLAEHDVRRWPGDPRAFEPALA
jgi:hypothetical protein